MKKLKQAFLITFSVIVFTTLMLVDVNLDKTSNASLVESECYPATEWTVQFSLQNAIAQGTDPEECDDSEGDCPRTCSGGCSGCFQSTCHDEDDTYYCGAISPIGSEDVIYCWRPEF